LYGAGTANNYLAGSLGIGTTSLTGYNLSIQKNITGASTNVFSIYQNSSVQSDVTGTANGIGSFTGISGTTALGTLRHFVAAQGTFAGGGTVTTQIGYSAASTLTSATNNYGFYGDIAAASGRWNLYMNGTAANYLAGDTAIGTTTTSGGRLTVRGSGTTSSTTALLVQNSTPTNLLQVLDNGFIDIGNAGASAAMRIFPFSTGYGSVDLSGRNIQFLSYVTTQSAVNGAYYFTGLGFSQTSGTHILANFTNTFNPTSGSGSFTVANILATINQTGGANGITRGLFVNPTLTAAADWRGIESVASSNANHTLLKLRNATVDVFTVKADSKIGFFNATPVAQPTTGIAEATFVENSGGTAVNVDSTFAGYTLQQIAQALKDLGILA
jgi:hypothetical protein